MASHLATSSLYACDVKRRGITCYKLRMRKTRRTPCHTTPVLGRVAEGGQLVLAEALLLPGQGDVDLEGAELFPLLQLLVLVLVHEVVDACVGGRDGWFAVCWCQSGSEHGGGASSGLVDSGGREKERR